MPALMYVIMTSFCTFYDARNRSATQRTDEPETAKNEERNCVNGERLFTTTTTTKSVGWPDVQVPCAAASNVIGRRSVTGDVEQLRTSSDRPPCSFVDDAPTATCGTQLDHDDAESFNLGRASRQMVDDAPDTGCKAETEAAQNSAFARCTAVTRFTSGEHDDARRSAAPPDVAANADVLATAAADAFASDRCPYAAVARAATQAASTAVSHVICQVRDLANGMTRDVVELELSARCVVRCNRSETFLCVC